MPEPPRHIVYLCWPNGWSLHHVGLALAEALAPHGIHVDVVDSRTWFARPTPADAVCLAHTDFYWPDFPYRDHVREVLAIVHDPDEVSTFTDRLTWADEPMHERPDLHVYDRVLTCSDEMAAVLRSRYGLDVWHAATHPHNAAALLGAARQPDAFGESGATRPVRFVSTAVGTRGSSWPRVLSRVCAPRFWTRDERGQFSVRQLRSAALRAHRKNVPWLARLERALATESHAAVDFRYGTRHAPLTDAEYVARLRTADVYVCTSYMEGGPLPVMEAVLAGAAVITTPVGQVANWVRDGENGVVCRTYADVERAARRYVREPALLRAHQARARALAQHHVFDVDGWRAFLTGRAVGA